jgi:hypothetical protein
MVKIHIGEVRGKHEYKQLLGSGGIFEPSCRKSLKIHFPVGYSKSRISRAAKALKEKKAD